MDARHLRSPKMCTVANSAEVSKPESKKLRATFRRSRHKLHLQPFVNSRAVGTLVGLELLKKGIKTRMTRRVSSLCEPSGSDVERTHIWKWNQESCYKELVLSIYIYPLLRTITGAGHVRALVLLLAVLQLHLSQSWQTDSHGTDSHGRDS